MSEIINLVESEPSSPIEEVEPSSPQFEPAEEIEFCEGPRVIEDFCCSDPVFGDFSCPNCGCHHSIEEFHEIQQMMEDYQNSLLSYECVSVCEDENN
jgi:hypothetical protein